MQISDLFHTGVDIWGVINISILLVYGSLEIVYDLSLKRKNLHRFNFYFRCYQNFTIIRRIIQANLITSKMYTIYK